MTGVHCFDHCWEYKDDGDMVCLLCGHTIRITIKDYSKKVAG